jgi:hypothetical protein
MSQLHHITRVRFDVMHRLTVSAVPLMLFGCGTSDDAVKPNQVAQQSSAISQSAAQSSSVNAGPVQPSNLSKPIEVPHGSAARVADSDSGGVPTLSTSTPALATADATSKKEWREVMAKSMPKESGCFTANYPETEWTSKPCHPHPNPHPIHHPEPGIQSVGHGTGGFARLTDSAIFKTTGSFPSAINITSEINNGDGWGNEYTLQLNTNRFISPTCNQCSLVGCLGWQQFTFEQQNNAFGFTDMLYIQSWLINCTNGNCPAGFESGGGTNCYRNSSVADVGRNFPASALPHVELSGLAAAGSYNAAILAQDGVTLTSVSVPDSVLGLGFNWSAAEFNVFGDGSSQQAVFNTGATYAVRLDLQGYQNVRSPDYSQTSALFTLESNNLNLVPNSLCPIGGGTQNGATVWPALTFLESNANPMPQAPFCLQTEFEPVSDILLF